MSGELRGIIQDLRNSSWYGRLFCEYTQGAFMGLRNKLGRVRKNIRNIISYAKKEISGNQEQYIVENIGLDFLKPDQPRALICYIDFDVINKVIRTGTTHSNQPEYYQIIRYFIDLGYAVDICSYDYRGEVKTDYYDVIFGFGVSFFNAKEANPAAKEIFFMTENPYNISVSREKARIKYFVERHGDLPDSYTLRSGRCFQEGDETRCKRILTFGDEKLINAPEAITRRIFPSGFGDDKYVMNLESRNRKKFLCLASDGFIHKGYDLLLDVFSRHPDWSLALCGGVFAVM